MLLFPDKPCCCCSSTHPAKHCPFSSSSFVMFLLSDWFNTNTIKSICTSRICPLPHSTLILHSLPAIADSYSEDSWCQPGLKPCKESFLEKKPELTWFMQGKDVCLQWLRLSRDQWSCTPGYQSLRALCSTGCQQLWGMLRHAIHTIVTSCNNSRMQQMQRRVWKNWGLIPYVTLLWSQGTKEAGKWMRNKA